MAAVAANFDKHKTHLLVQKHRWKVYGAFDADDVLQDCLVKCYEKIIRSGLSSGYNYNAYFGIALTHNFQYYAQKRRKTSDLSFDFLLESTDQSDDAEMARSYELARVLHQMSDDEATDGIAQAEAIDQHYEAINTAFEKLPEKYQEILRMDMNGLKYKEICRVLGLRMSQCKMRLKTARDLIKAQLGAYPKIDND